MPPFFSRFFSLTIAHRLYQLADQLLVETVTLTCFIIIEYAGKFRESVGS